MQESMKKLTNLSEQGREFLFQSLPQTARRHRAGIHSQLEVVVSHDASSHNQKLLIHLFLPCSIKEAPLSDESWPSILKHLCKAEGGRRKELETLLCIISQASIWAGIQSNSFFQGEAVPPRVFLDEVVFQEKKKRYQR